VGLFCALFFPASFTEAASKYGDEALELGAAGDSVTILQEDLQKLGYLGKSSITGNYDEETEKAVIKFQSDHGIEENGKVGPGTGLHIQKELAKQEKPQTIVKTAMDLKGTPYAWGGTSPSGFDCSGFVSYVYAKNDIQLPHSAKEMYKTGSSIPAPEIGDLVFFSTYASYPSHVGVYIGNNQFISSTTNRGVKVDSLSDSYWKSRYLGAKRVI
jgi:cell wall-associated NlpC family hydrolase